MTARLAQRDHEAADGHALQSYVGHGVAVQLQRPGPPLLPAPGPTPGRPAGQPASRRRSGPRRATRSPRACATCSRRWRATAGARIQVAEVPPGPPVLQTLVAEVYGPDPARRLEVAQTVKDIFSTTPGVVDVDWYVEGAAAQDRHRRGRAEGGGGRRERGGARLAGADGRRRRSRRNPARRPGRERRADRAAAAARRARIA